MIKSSIENFQPKPKPNSESQTIESTSVQVLPMQCYTGVAGKIKKLKMIPIIQTKVVVQNSKGETIIRGNCLAACIASLLDLPISEVPNIETLYGIEEPFYWEVLWRWLGHLGYEISTDERFKCFHGDESKSEFKEQLKDKYYLVSGKSPRGFQHICIYQNGKLIHDPHPTKEGILTEEYFQSLETVEGR